MHNLDTLYISDLDGTLLTPECKVSDETASALNTMIANGLFFTVATARSASSAAPLLEKLNLRLPVILMNGVVIYDMENGSLFPYARLNRKQHALPWLF